MSNKKYFSNRPNYFIDLFVTLLFTLVGLLMFFISPSYSLSWNDEEWLQSGCPKTASGKWAADNPETTNLRFISINNSEVIYTSQNDLTHKFGISKSSFVSKNKYVKIELRPLNNQKEVILKIRPHLIHMDLQKETNNPNCLIKVFTFKDDKHAKTDRYFGWNIFSPRLPAAIHIPVHQTRGRGTGCCSKVGTCSCRQIVCSGGLGFIG